ncbi:hypothetical protein BpHYR1_008430 [Brachionus plicatilis]|uniref:Uncharacterized protein n=1 Tax=Brachionus plicatilis TaxID=10195 RepID=A0A3M7SB77_BRAPC|nr:hypothetical protein BpHYR1_008430 [Brachionus plicatilis]
MFAKINAAVDYQIMFTKSKYKNFKVILNNHIEITQWNFTLIMKINNLCIDIFIILIFTLLSVKHGTISYSAKIHAQNELHLIQILKKAKKNKRSTLANRNNFLTNKKSSKRHLFRKSVNMTYELCFYFNIIAKLEMVYLKKDLINKIDNFLNGRSQKSYELLQPVI